MPDPGFLLDDNTTSFDHTKGGDGNYADFSMSLNPAATVGDDFDLATAEATKLNEVPRDGLAFSIGCDAAECPTANASVALLDIITTDGAVPSDPRLFFVMPPPVTKSVQIRCLVLQGTIVGQIITIPAPLMARIMMSGATRIQASFIRSTLMGGNAPVVAFSGHAIVGFTTP